MKVVAIHSYLVHPEKGVETKSVISGAAIPKVGNMYKMLETIFNEAPKECKYDIAFIPNEKGEQKNECRDLILKYIKSEKLVDGELLANRLQNITTKRSKLGLFFLILGKDGDQKRLVISRFPADSGIVAEEHKNKLSVQYLERIFMKSSKTYKSACYEGISYDSDFWTGRAIDKQIDSDLTISDYWIKEFLLSDFATTGERGTKRLATALKDAMNGTDSIEIKEEITSALKLAKGFNRKVLSAGTFIQRLALSDSAQQLIKAQMNPALFDEQFTLMATELNKHFAYKTIELDNGAFLSAETEKFDQIFQRKNTIKQEKVTFSTTGKIVDEWVKKVI